MNRFDEIRAREQTATRGPWVAAGIDKTHATVYQRRAFEDDCMADNYIAAMHRDDATSDPEQFNALNDAIFVANAREDIPWLLAELERVTAEYNFTEKRIRVESELRVQAEVDCDRWKVKVESAENTLNHLGYTYHGGELWKPPIGNAPDFDLVDRLRTRVEALERVLNMTAISGRYQCRFCSHQEQHSTGGKCTLGCGGTNGWHLWQFDQQRFAGGERITKEEAERSKSSE